MIIDDHDDSDRLHLQIENWFGCDKFGVSYWTYRYTYLQLTYLNKVWYLCHYFVYFCATYNDIVSTWRTGVYTVYRAQNHFFPAEYIIYLLFTISREQCWDDRSLLVFWTILLNKMNIFKTVTSYFIYTISFIASITTSHICFTSEINIGNDHPV